MSEELLLSTKNAGILLGVSEWTIERMARDGELPFVRVRGSLRIDRRDVLALIDARKREAAEEVAARKAAADAIRADADAAVNLPRRGRGRPRKAEGRRHA